MMQATVSGRNRVWVFTVKGLTSDEVQVAINEGEGTIDLMARWTRTLPNDRMEIDANDGAVIVVEDEDDKSAWIADVSDVEVQDNERYVLVALDVR